MYFRTEFLTGWGVFTHAVTIAEKLSLRTEWIMVKAKDGTDSVESFEMEVADEEVEESDDDDDDEVFVKKGGRHGNENGSAKKPLIKGNNRVIF